MKTFVGPIERQMFFEKIEGLIRKFKNVLIVLAFVMPILIYAGFEFKLFDSSSANHSPKICCFEKLTNSCIWLLGNDVNSVTLYGI